MANYLLRKRTLKMPAHQTTIERIWRDWPRALRSIAALGIAALLALAAAGCDDKLGRSDQAPEAASSFTPKPRVAVARAMIVAAHPLAAEAGHQILRAGGTAIDAAIAAQLVLGLVEPQSSGLGGGAVLLHWDATARAIATYDGRETAPAAARPDRFLRQGRPIPFDEAVRSGLAVGVPGLVRMLELIHRRHGRLDWQRLFEPAIKLAEEGFAVSPRLHRLLTLEGPARFASAGRDYFFDARARPHPVGHVLRNPAYAGTLAKIASRGAETFYSGEIAAAIIEAVSRAPFSAGDLAAADLRDYRAMERAPVCVPYRSHRVCGMGPPSSGGIAVGQTLMLLDGFDLGRGRAAAMRPQAMHLIAEALKLAFADRNWHVADAGSTSHSLGLIDPAYMAARRRLISPHATLVRAYPGIVTGRQIAQLGSDATEESVGTSHVSVVDGAGNAIALTTTIEAGFGSRLWAAGFLLNNQMTDFSFRPVDAQGRLVANRIAPGKRPRSSMSPTIVLDASGEPVIITGSPGGSRIIPYMVKTLVAMIDWELDSAEAASLPNLASQGRQVVLEAAGARLVDALASPRQWLGLLNDMIALKALGQEVRLETMTSGTHTIARRANGGFDGGADPRREGMAIGD